MRFKTQHNVLTEPAPFYNNVIELALAHSEQMRFWTLSRGHKPKNQGFSWHLLNQARVEKPGLYRQNNLVPVRRGLVCPSIFGQPYSHNRRSQLGFIELAFPMAQSWLLRDSSLAYYGVFTACSRLCLTRLIYGQAFTAHYDTTVHPYDHVHLSAEWTFTPWHVHVLQSESFDAPHGSFIPYGIKIGLHLEHINLYQWWIGRLLDFKDTVNYETSPIEFDQIGFHWNTLLPEDEQRSLPNFPCRNQAGKVVPKVNRTLSGSATRSTGSSDGHKSRRANLEPRRASRVELPETSVRPVSGRFFQRPDFGFELCKLKPWNFVSRPQVLHCGSGLSDVYKTWNPWMPPNYLQRLEDDLDLRVVEGLALPPSSQSVKKLLSFYVNFAFQNTQDFFLVDTHLNFNAHKSRRFKSRSWRRWLYRGWKYKVRLAKGKVKEKSRVDVRLISIQRAYESFPNHHLHFIWHKVKAQNQPTPRILPGGFRAGVLDRPDGFEAGQGSDDFLAGQASYGFLPEQASDGFPAGPLPGAEAAGPLPGAEAAGPLPGAEAAGATRPSMLLDAGQKSGGLKKPRSWQAPLHTGLKNRYNTPFLMFWHVYRCSTVKALQAFEPYGHGLEIRQRFEGSTPVLYRNMDCFVSPIVPVYSNSPLSPAAYLNPLDRVTSGFICRWEEDFLYLASSVPGKPPEQKGEVYPDVETPEMLDLKDIVHNHSTILLPHAFQVLPNDVVEEIPPFERGWGHHYPVNKIVQCQEKAQRLQLTSTRCNALPSHFPYSSFHVDTPSIFAPDEKIQRVQSYVWNKAGNAFFQAGVHFEQESVPKFETRMTTFMPTYVQPCQWMRKYQGLFQSADLKHPKGTVAKTFYGANPVLKPFFQNQAYRQHQKRKLNFRQLLSLNLPQQLMQAPSLSLAETQDKRPGLSFRRLAWKKEALLKKLRAGEEKSFSTAGSKAWKHPQENQTRGLCFGVFDFVAKVNVGWKPGRFSRFGCTKGKRTVWQTPLHHRINLYHWTFAMTSVDLLRRETFDAAWFGPSSAVKSNLVSAVDTLACAHGETSDSTADKQGSVSGSWYARLAQETLQQLFRGVLEGQRLRCTLKKQFRMYGGPKAGPYFQRWFWAKVGFETSLSVKQRRLFLHIPICLRPELWCVTSAMPPSQQLSRRTMLGHTRRVTMWPKQKLKDAHGHLMPDLWTQSSLRAPDFATGDKLSMPVRWGEKEKRIMSRLRHLWRLQSWTRACITPKLGGTRWYRTLVHVHLSHEPESLRVKRLHVRHGNDLHAFIHRQPHLVRNRLAVVHNNWIHILRHRYDHFRKFMLPHTLENGNAMVEVPNFAMVNYIDRGMTNKMSHCGADALAVGLQHLDLQQPGERAWKKLYDYQQAARRLFTAYDKHASVRPNAFPRQLNIELATANMVSSREVWVSPDSIVGPPWELSNSDSYSAPDLSSLPTLQRSVRRTWSRHRRPWRRKPYYSSNNWFRVDYPRGGRRRLLREQRRMEKQRVKFIRRYKMLKRLAPANISWMVLRRLPVLPADCRPVFQLDNILASTDLTTLYSNVLYYNEFPYEDRAHDYERSKTHFLQRHAGFPVISGRYLASVHLERWSKACLHLQSAVDALIDTSKQADFDWNSGLVMDVDSHRLYKSLTDRLKGKTGRFRFNLLGKRVDYSARSVIVVGPTLHVHQCGLPRPMAFKLFHFHVLRTLIVWGYATTRKQAEGLIQQASPEANRALESVLDDVPVLLNRAPTLHRLGFQAFQPCLVRGRAILLHPLVCTGFNADFDGDQMGVHVPLSSLAKAEAQRLMISASQVLGPANSEPMLVPSQDMVLGCYVSTHFDLRRRCEMWKHKLLEVGYFSSVELIHHAYELGRVNLHTPILYYVKNFESDVKQYTNEIQIQSSGRCTHIFKSMLTLETHMNFRPGYVLFTTVGRVLLNDLLMQPPF